MTDATGASPPTIELGAFKPTTVEWSFIKRKIDVLFMTVNENEFNAVARIISNPQRTDTGGPLGPIYFGEIGKNYVSLVRSSQGSIGVAGSTATCQDVIEELNPNVIVLLGVCFGLQKNKQSLGDLLIADQMAFYAPGRYNKDGSQYNRAPQPECNARLQRVFKDGKITWIPPGDVKTKPKVHFGLVLSGPKLIDNEEETRRLKIQFPEALGGEMEAEGIYSLCERKKIPWILCKAICDWADGTKVNEWQPFAAAVSASFVRNVLEQTYLPETKSVSQREQQMPIEQDLVDRGESSKSDEASISLFKSEVQESCSGDVPGSSAVAEARSEDPVLKILHVPGSSAVDEARSENPKDSVPKTLRVPESSSKKRLNPDDKPRDENKRDMVSEIQYLVRAEICLHLNVKRDLGGDFKTLGGILRMTNEQIKFISGKDNPADEVLTWWETQKLATVSRFREILVEMGRDDIVEIIDGEYPTETKSASQREQMPIEQDLVDCGDASSSAKAESSKSDKNTKLA